MRVGTGAVGGITNGGGGVAIGGGGSGGKSWPADDGQIWVDIEMLWNCNNTPKTRFQTLVLKHSLYFQRGNIRKLYKSIFLFYKYQHHKCHIIIPLTFAARSQVLLQVTSIPAVVNAFFITHQTERDTLPISAGEIGLIAALWLVKTWTKEEGSVLAWKR